MTEESTYPAWHQALAYAVTGQSLPDLGRQRRPDVPALAAQLEELAANRDIDLTWSAADADYLVPPDLMEGIGAAQFWAALGELRRALGWPRRVGGGGDRRPAPDAGGEPAADGASAAPLSARANLLHLPSARVARRSRHKVLAAPTRSGQACSRTLIGCATTGTMGGVGSSSVEPATTSSSALPILPRIAARSRPDREQP